MKIFSVVSIIVCLSVALIFPVNGITQRTQQVQTRPPNTSQPAAKTASSKQPARLAPNGPATETNVDDTVNPANVKRVAGPDFVIGAEDVLGIWVWHEPDFTRKVFVRPDGKIGLPFLRDIQAAGLTTTQLADQIKEESKRLLSDPEVSVTVEEIHSQSVNLLGAVRSPGVYPLGAPLTLVDLLARAGGLTEFAKRDEILILRKQGPFMSTRFVFSYNDFVNNRNFQQNLELKNQDTVIVRE